MNECKPLLLGRTPHVQGRAVQVDPIKPTLKAPGIKLLKLKYDKPLTIFAFKFNLRRYNKVGPARRARHVINTRLHSSFCELNGTL